MRFPGMDEGVLAQEKDTYIPCHAPGDGTCTPQSGTEFMHKKCTEWPQSEWSCTNLPPLPRPRNKNAFPVGPSWGCTDEAPRPSSTGGVCTRSSGGGLRCCTKGRLHQWQQATLPPPVANTKVPKCDGHNTNRCSDKGAGVFIKGKDGAQFRRLWRQHQTVF